MSLFVDSFRSQAERVLSEHRRIVHNWTESSGGWVHLEVLPDGPLGFIVHANVGPEYALVIAGRTLSREFPVAGQDEAEPVATGHAAAIVDLLGALLSPSTRLRERRAGNATFHWSLEREMPGGEWCRLAQWWSIAPWRYVGARREVVYQNRYVRPPAHAG